MFALLKGFWFSGSFLPNSSAAERAAMYDELCALVLAKKIEVRAEYLSFDEEGKRRAFAPSRKDKAIFQMI